MARGRGARQGRRAWAASNTFWEVPTSSWANTRRPGAKTLQAIRLRAVLAAKFSHWPPRSCLDGCMVVLFLQLRVVWVVWVRVDAAIKDLAQARAQQHGRDGHGAHRLIKWRAAASVGGLGWVTRGYEPALS